MCLPSAHLMSHDYPLYLCIAGVLIVPDHNISCVSSIDCALQMLQVPILGGMLKEGPQDRHLFYAVATYANFSHSLFSTQTQCPCNSESILLSDLAFYHQ